MTDRAWTLRLIERHPFGLLITGDAEYPRVSHLPLIAEERGTELFVIGHVARGNSHAQSILTGARATVVFQGPHAFVSASWYEEPYATVPTWNYAAVHVTGDLRHTDEWRAVRLHSKKAEAASAEPWDPDRLDARYRDSQLRGIVAFELRAEAIYAKAKLSQNRTEADRERVIAHLSASTDQVERECAAAMAQGLRAGS
ncbi:MAG: FMN-binding negative transcriptional regulator [Candidatus Eremiobacteraeota bacterium]|nr:FMN-binding negative transcriptional regulator [Candidatus Eremiobacteraeota bacterium]